METAQIQRNVDLSSQERAEIYVPVEEFVCANCGYDASNRDGYAYHVNLCAIPA
jgi:hypothetical protein